ncbi:uncharacterized protein LOC117891677 [Drosophila subobscura]|uniref:uncharacterized protein LOC117891677 n=1 Tax=Drosophila subobscura TaxID=7241 RepID=UPI00155A4C2B|nr:uncharacterized protein LOC117891677 [Drosophila subobscura]
MDTTEEPFALPAEREDDGQMDLRTHCIEDEDTLAENPNPELLESGIPLELFLSATTSALELDTVSSHAPSMSESDLLGVVGVDKLEDGDGDDQPLVLFIVSENGCDPPVAS